MLDFTRRAIASNKTRFARAILVDAHLQMPTLGSWKSGAPVLHVCPLGQSVDTDVWQSWKHVRDPTVPRHTRPSPQCVSSHFSPTFAPPIATQLVVPSLGFTTAHVSPSAQ
jgi:hypothetical protein